MTKKETQKTDDIMPQSEAQKILRLESQCINGSWLPDTYEAWSDGIYYRKSFVPGPSGPVLPSLYQPAPNEHKGACLKRVTERPCYVSAIGRRIDDNRDLIGLTFLAGAEVDDDGVTRGTKSAGQRWETVWVTYDQIADSRKLLSLSEAVFPVKSSNAAALSDFLTESYSANVGLVAVQSVVRRTGYHEVNGRHGWVMGKDWIGDGNVKTDPKRDRISTGIRTNGSEEEWLRFTTEEWNAEPQSWIIRWMLAASFASPLLRHISLRTFILHHYTQAKGGKSLLASLAQSAWGNPKELTLSLNRSTQNSLTEVFKDVSDLPLLYDELQGNEIDASNFVMQLCTEDHKNRTKQDGGLIAHEAKLFKSVVRTTGEQTLAGATREDLGGQARRVLEVRHPGISEKQGERMFPFTDRPHHYGYAGIRFLHKLKDVVNSPEVESLRKDFEQNGKDISRFVDGILPADTVRHLSAIMLAETLMLCWVYGFSRQEADRLAQRDTYEIAANWLRVASGTDSLWRKAVDALNEHRSSNANLYADATTPAGLLKLKQDGSRNNLGLVAVINAGPKKDEIWYYPTNVNEILRKRFSVPPQRIWEDLASAEAGILMRDKNRLERRRQIAGAIDKGVSFYVVSAPRMQLESEMVETKEVTDSDIVVRDSFLPETIYLPEEEYIPGWLQEEIDDAANFPIEE